MAGLPQAYLPTMKQAIILTMSASFEGCGSGVAGNCSASKLFGKAVVFMLEEICVHTTLST